MNNPDSFDRIVSYFHALARQPFEYKGQRYVPYSKLVVSDKVFRGYSCPEGCGACCMAVTLVWDEPPEADHLAIFVTGEDYVVNGVVKKFYVYHQRGTMIGRSGRFCDYLNERNGRCGVYKDRPLPCRFELFKFVHGVSTSTARAMVRLPGRGWALTRVDKSKGSMCAIQPFDEALTRTHIRDLKIIKTWMDAFKIENDCKAVLAYLEAGTLLFTAGLQPQPLTLRRAEDGFLDRNPDCEKK